MPCRLAITFALCLAPALAAHAKGPKWDEGQGHKSGNQAGVPGVNVNVNVGIGTTHRSVITSYYSGYYARGHCPPGLAKKHNGCMPPGHAKRFIIGQPLPHYVVYSPLPPDLAVRLVAPAGYGYVYLDGHVLLMAMSTRLVVDSFAISVNVR